MVAGKINRGQMASRYRHPSHVGGSAAGRTHVRQGGEREVDLIVESEDRRVVALEVKLTGAVRDHDVVHLRWLADHLGDELLDAAVITTGSQAYRRPDGIAVIPAALLGP